MRSGVSGLSWEDSTPLTLSSHVPGSHGSGRISAVPELIGKTPGAMTSSAGMGGSGLARTVTTLIERRFETLELAVEFARVAGADVGLEHE